MTVAPARALLDALEAAGRAFEGDDAVAAAALLDDVLRAQVALQDAGARLDDASLEEARRLHDELTAAALAAARRLDEQLSQAGAARRAAGAYGR